MSAHPVTQNGAADRRYSVALEFCGYETPRYVARFCGEWIGQSASYSGAALLAIGHNQVRKGALVIEEQRTPL